MKDETIKTVAAQIGIVLLSGLALTLGYDGTILGFALASLANSGQFIYNRKKQSDI